MFIVLLHTCTNIDGQMVNKLAMLGFPRHIKMRKHTTNNVTLILVGKSDEIPIEMQYYN